MRGTSLHKVVCVVFEKLMSSWVTSDFKMSYLFMTLGIRLLSTEILYSSDRIFYIAVGRSRGNPLIYLLTAIVARAFWVDEFLILTTSDSSSELGKLLDSYTESRTSLVPVFA